MLTLSMNEGAFSENHEDFHQSRFSSGILENNEPKYPTAAHRVGVISMSTLPSASCVFATPQGFSKEIQGGTTQQLH